MSTDPLAQPPTPLVRLSPDISLPVLFFFHLSIPPHLSDARVAKKFGDVRRVLLSHKAMMIIAIYDNRFHQRTLIDGVLPRHSNRFHSSSTSNSPKQSIIN